LAKTTRVAGDLDLRVIALNDGKTNEDFKAWFPLDLRTFPVSGTERFGLAHGLYGDLQSSNPDLLHLHGLWKYPAVVARRWARHSGRPYLVSTHGMLEPWALQQSRLLKGIANVLYQRACLQEAFCIRATSMMEAESIRKAGYRNLIALVPNGVEPPDSTVPKSPKPLGQRKRALFLSRIHPKKGLLNLIKAWHVLAPKDWELAVVGPDDGGHLAKVRALVRQCGLQGRVDFAGDVRGQGRTRIYDGADLFVLPSYSENFGLVIAEALSCGVPVITTRATPWQDIEQHQCGWWTDMGAEPLIEALRQAFALSSDELSQMGARGRKLILEKYTWPPIGRSMVEVYHWMLGRRGKPACILD
jgi:glycosyltransferase involved in cell wall biosynthesis